MADIVLPKLHDPGDATFHLLVDGVKEYAIYMLDADGCVTSWNAGAARIKGYAAEEIVGRNFSTFFRPQDRDAGEPERILAAARRNGRFQGVGTRVRKDGSEFTADVVVTTLYAPDGGICGFGKVTRDITERVKYERALEEGSRRKDVFLAMLAHELRNPLAPIMSGLALLNEDGSVSAGARQVLNIIGRQAGHLVRLLDDLLDVARIAAGRISLRSAPVALGDAVAIAVEMAQPVVAAHQHTLHLDLPGHALTVEGDFARVAQILSNLLNNAAKFTDPGGNIWLSVYRLDDQATITVKDDGIGILACDIPHLFETFYRVDNPRHALREGMGLGLSLASELVRLHGGSIEARSEGLGRGTEVTVRLPCAPADETAAPAPATAGTNASPLRVLVVDDNADAGTSLAAVLRLLGHETIALTSGVDALDALESFRPGAIIIDIGMPGMNGHELARRVRRLLPFRDVRLIALSGYGQEQDRRRSDSAGFDVHLVKPVDMADLSKGLAATAG